MVTLDFAILAEESQIHTVFVLIYEKQKKTQIKFVGYRSETTGTTM
jgi:hypothetical protein